MKKRHEDWRIPRTTDNVPTFWETIKYHLSESGLKEVIEKYPFLREEAELILRFHPQKAISAREYVGFSKGDKVLYIGGYFKDLGNGKILTVEETPIGSAVRGIICVSEEKGSVFMVMVSEIKLVPATTVIQNF